MWINGPFEPRFFVYELKIFKCYINVWHGILHARTPWHITSISTERVAGAAAVSVEATKFANYADLDESYNLVPNAIKTLGSSSQHTWGLVE